MRTALGGFMSRRRWLDARLVAVGAAVAAGVALVRARHLRWGATDDELNATLPGDELVPAADLTATRAVTARAAADEVWPWVAQLGQGRGGFYSYDFLENMVGCDIHSAERVVPEWQSIKVGDAVRLHPELDWANATSVRFHVGLRPARSGGWHHTARGAGALRLLALVGALARGAGRANQLRHEPANVARHQGARRASSPLRPSRRRHSLDAEDTAAHSRAAVTTSADLTRRFTSDKLAGLDEPVRRYFRHAIRDGAALSNGVRMAMSGRIKIGLWLPFTAEQTVDGRSFAWSARVGWRSLMPLRVTDRYADAAGSTEGRLLGRVTLFHAKNVNTARSAATRAAIESVVFAPPSVLPGRGVTWRAETDSIILARFDLPPERPEVRARIDEHGAIRTVSALRWGNAGEKTFQYIPFGGDVHAERRFGELVLPSTLSVGWWFDTPRYAPFFRAEINAVTPTL
jgi:hypothetical protein